MVKLKSKESGEFDLIPEGTVVPARLESVEANSFQWNNEQVDKLRWHFVITEQGDWFGKTIQGSTSVSFTAHPNCRAYNWAVAISGKTYKDGEELDTDDILAMPCNVIIKHRDDSQGRTWMDVRDVLPPQRSAQAQSPVAAVPHDESPF